MRDGRDSERESIMRTSVALGLYTLKSAGFWCLALAHSEAEIGSVCLHVLALAGTVPFAAALANQLIFSRDDDRPDLPHQNQAVSCGERS